MGTRHTYLEILIIAWKCTIFKWLIYESFVKTFCFVYYTANPVVIFCWLFIILSSWTILNFWNFFHWCHPTTFCTIICFYTPIFFFYLWNILNLLKRKEKKWHFISPRKLWEKNWNKSWNRWVLKIKINNLKLFSWKLVLP